MTEEQNVVAVPIKKAVKEGTPLIVIDQRETELTRYAKLWLRPKPGTEAALIGAMIRVIIDESLDDHEFLADTCEGVDSLRNTLWSYDLIRVERLTTVPHEQIQAAARLFASNPPAATLFALETVVPELRADCVRALVNLALATGSLGKPSAGLYPLFVGANEQGSKDVGCSPTYLPGYRPVSDENARQRFQSSWDATVPSSQGLGIKEVAEAVRQGQIKALHLIGDSPNYTNGELGDFIEAVKGLEFLLVQDTFRSELTEVADVVLPSATFAEKEGTYTNIERRVQLLRPALRPKDEEEPDWHIISQIATHMGTKGFDYDSAEAVFDEINNLVEMYGGMSYERLQSGGLQWPCRAIDMVDTPILYADGFESHKVRLGAMKLNEEPAHRDPDYPFLLARGRVLHQPDRETKIVKVDGRNTVVRDEVMELHPEDARELGVVEGDWIEAVLPQGRIGGMARLSGPQKGLVSTTTLFGQLAAELERSEAPDPMLKTPGLPLLPVRIEKVAGVAAN